MERLSILRLLQLGHFYFLHPILAFLCQLLPLFAFPSLSVTFLITAAVCYCRQHSQTHIHRKGPALKNVPMLEQLFSALVGKASAQYVCLKRPNQMLWFS